MRAINIGREENANSEVKKPDREGKVGQEECYQSSYYSETLELNPPGETPGVQLSYPRGEEAVVFIQATAGHWLRDASKR